MPSFLEALKGRYGAADDTKYDENAFLVSATVPTHRAKKWEMVGLEDARQKQSVHTKLTVISLPDAKIDKAESVDGEIKEASLTRATDLDLSRNKNLADWTALSTIIYGLPAIRELQLNEIPFSDLKLPPTRNLTVLTLNGTNLAWSELRSLTGAQTLKELHFESNGIRAEGGDDSFVLQSVETLSLGFNGLGDWAVVETCCASFPALKDLRVHGNDLPDCEEPVRCFPMLGALWISDNPRITLKTVHCVTLHCSALTSLRVSYSTLLPKLSETQARMHVIAAVPSLTSLNNGSVRPKERADAELYYLQRALSVTEESVRSLEFPRWPALRDKYKTVVVSQGGGGSNCTVMLQLKLRTLGQPLVEKTLPSTLTVSKLKAFAAGLWPELRIENLSLVWYAGADLGSAPPTALDDDDATLASVGVGTGSVIEAIQS